MYPAGILCGLVTYSRTLDLTGYVAMVHLKLVNIFVQKQVMLPATLPEIESEILGCKNLYFAKIT